MKFIEFDYETVDNRILNIKGEMEGNQIYFKAFDNEKRVSKGSLTNLDFHNIESIISNISEEEIDYESDYYERQND